MAKKLIILIAIISIGWTWGSEYNEGKIPAKAIKTDTTLFDGNLSPTDDNVQTALETLDDMVSAGGGGSCWELDVNSDIMPVSGACTDALWETDVNGDLQPKA